MNKNLTNYRQDLYNQELSNFLETLSLKEPSQSKPNPEEIKDLLEHLAHYYELAISDYSLTHPKEKNPYSRFTILKNMLTSLPNYLQPADNYFFNLEYTGPRIFSQGGYSIASFAYTERGAGGDAVPRYVKFNKQTGKIIELDELIYKELPHISRKEDRSIEELLSLLQTKEQIDPDKRVFELEPLENCLHNHATHLELRTHFLELLALTIIYSNNHVSSESNYRSRLFLDDIEAQIPGLQLDSTKLDQMLTTSNLTPEEEPPKTITSSKSKTLSRVKKFFGTRTKNNV